MVLFINSIWLMQCIPLWFNHWISPSFTNLNHFLKKKMIPNLSCILLFLSFFLPSIPKYFIYSMDASSCAQHLYHIYVWLIRCMCVVFTWDQNNVSWTRALGQTNQFTKDFPSDQSYKSLQQVISFLFVVFIIVIIFLV